MLFEYDILSGGPCIILLNHPMSIYKQVWLPKGDYPFPRYREGRAEQLDTTGYEAWELTWEETFTHNNPRSGWPTHHTSYLVIIPGFKPIVYGDFAHQGQSSCATFPRGTLDSLMWKSEMTVEYFDQWSMETHYWKFKRKYWLFGPYIGFLNGEKVGEKSELHWQKYLLEKYDPLN